MRWQGRVRLFMRGSALATFGLTAIKWLCDILTNPPNYPKILGIPFYFVVSMFWVLIGLFVMRGERVRDTLIVIAFLFVFWSVLLLVIGVDDIWKAIRGEGDGFNY